MSWLERAGDGHDLRFARFENDRWEPAATIAHGENFFVNWADFPSIREDGVGTLWAHWLQRGQSGGTYDYGVQVSSSADGGQSWAEPRLVHDDTSPTEHGFVSAFETAEGIGFTWLDGRETGGGHAGGEAADSPGPAMTLRSRLVSADGDFGPESLVDDRVCDCCQTAAAATTSGAVLAYRDRSPEEVRDIYVARMSEGGWSEGKAVFADGWVTPACPVNGPAVAARGDDVVVAWFTAADGVPKAKVAFSSDEGASFGTPSVVDDGNPAGRVDVFLAEDGSALVTWLERSGGDAAEIRLRRVWQDGRTEGSHSLAQSSAGRPTGFPRLVELAPDRFMLAWTDIGEESRVMVSELRVEEGG